MSRRLQARVARAVALVLVALAVGVAAGGLERRTTWYLASDQYAFLTFAGDLMRGRVLHPADDLELFAASPWGSQPRDALFQTYYWSGNHLFSRYPPGYPAMLALAGRIGGETAQHLLNPALFLVLLGVVAWACWAALRRHDRSLAAGAGVAAVWMVLLLPTQLHLWGTTVVRDLPAHLLALGAIVAALYAAFGSAGLLLGFACSVRPDAVLWGVSLAAMMTVQRARAQSVLRAALGFAVGVAPLLAYNHLASGSIFGFTQAGEFDRVLSAIQGGLASAFSGSPWVVLAQTHSMQSGGAFRLAHVATTLPGLLAHLEHAFSWSAVLIAVALWWSLRARRVVAAAFAPYPLIAIPFYSFWSHPDPRYLAGVSLALIVLAATGAVVVCRGLADPARPAWQRLGGAAAAIAVGVAAPLGLGAPGGWGAATQVALAAAVLSAPLVSFLARAPGGLQAIVLAPGLALAIVGMLRLATGERGRDPFQRAQVARAREAIEALVPAGGLVAVGEGLGRPAENIDHYTHATARYVAELRLLRSDLVQAAARHALASRRTFLLVAQGDTEPATTLGGRASLRAVDRRDGAALYDWFVDPRAARDGAELYEVIVPEATLAAVRAHVRQSDAPAEGDAGSDAAGGDGPGGDGTAPTPSPGAAR